MNHFSDVFRKVSKYNAPGQFNAQRAFIYTFAGNIADDFTLDGWKMLLELVIAGLIQEGTVSETIHKSPLDIL